MNMLVAMASPMSAVARRLASRNQAASWPDRIDDLVLHGPGRELGVAEALQVAGARLLGHGAHELAGDRGVAVDHGPGAALLHLGQRLVADGHDDVAADHRVGLAGGDARRPELAGVGGDADMRPDRAALLGEARHVERGDALALEVRRHAQDGADGDHAGAADAGDQDAPGLGRARAGRASGRGGRSPAPASALPLRSVPPSTVTKLGQKPLMQE